MKKKLKLIISAMLMICLVISLSAAAYADFNSSYKTNQNVEKTVVYNTEANITDATLSYGELPKGYSLSKDSHNIYLSGTTTQTGSYECGLWVNTESGLEVAIVHLNITQGSDEYLSLDNTITPNTSPKPSATPKPNEPPVITKHPTGETVEPGGEAKFIARADFADEFVWRIVSKDTTNTITAKEAPSYFSGLQVSGTDTDTLVLSNIPTSMNGWSVECRFKNANGSSFTTGAVISVYDSSVMTTPKPTAKEPVINTQPRDEKKDLGDTCTLSVSAISPDNGTLYYQWYKSTDGKKENMQPINDANDPTYAPEEIDGTVYYCVGISNAKDGKESKAIFSNMVAVTYSDNSIPMQTPQPTPNAAQTPAPQASSRPATNTSSNEGGSLRTSLIFFAITGVLALIALGGIVFYLIRSSKADKKSNDYYDMDDYR